MKFTKVKKKVKKKKLPSTIQKKKRKEKVKINHSIVYTLNTNNYFKYL